MFRLGKVGVDKDAVQQIVAPLRRLQHMEEVRVAGVVDSTSVFHEGLKCRLKRIVCVV